MKLTKTLGLYLLWISAMGFALPVQADLLPPNDWHLYDDIHSKDSNIDQALFNQIIDRVINFYLPLAKKHGGVIAPSKAWEDATVNASAGRVGPLWMVNMYGGLARRPEISPDGFALVVCHEIGHLFGGFPFRRSILGRWSWHANEGEADYFATQSCAREIWRSDLQENAKHAATVDAHARQACDQVWPDQDMRNLCYRISNAGSNLAHLLAALRNKGETPTFATPDQSQIRKTSMKHPAAQCRMDTYLQGALCNVAFDPNRIPGKIFAGTVGAIFDFAAEKDAAKSSCHIANKDVMGLRPACWFRSRNW